MQSARAAVPEDLDVVLGLASEVRSEKHDDRGADTLFRREGSAATDAQSIRNSLVDDHQRVVVGEFEGVVLGYGLAILEILPDGAKLGRVEALYVTPAARGVGIGESMMLLLLDSLRQDGCFAIDSHALPGDRETKNFFEGFGLKARLLTVSKPL